MSRTEAKRKDASVIDETPGAYKSIAAIMAAQEDVVEVVVRPSCNSQVDTPSPRACCGGAAVSASGLAAAGAEA